MSVETSNNDGIKRMKIDDDCNNANMRDATIENVYSLDLMLTKNKYIDGNIHTSTTTDNFVLFWKKLHQDAIEPKMSYDDAGFDVYSVETITINPGNFANIKTGIAVEISQPFDHSIGVYIQIKERSGHAIKGLFCAAGVIDRGWRGELKAIIHNHGKEPVTIEKGERCIQAIPITYAQITHIIETPVLRDSKRGKQGFGSTGKY